MKPLLPLILLGAPFLWAQSMTIEEYEPKSTLVVPERRVTRARFPFIDVHLHQRAGSPEAADRLVKDMDALNMRIMVNLSGGYGERLKAAVAALKGKYPDRFAVFANIDFTGIDDPDYGARAARQLREDVRDGAQGDRKSVV